MGAHGPVPPQLTGELSTVIPAKGRVEPRGSLENQARKRAEKKPRKRFRQRKGWRGPGRREGEGDTGAGRTAPAFHRP